MKRLICLIASLGILCVSLYSPAPTALAEEGNVLTICNWEDYIAVNEDTGDTLADEFVGWYKENYGEDVEVKYTTRGTTEIMYNDLKINPGAYDLVCPSDYMIQKMIAEDMLEKFDNGLDDVPSYRDYGSPYLKSLFEEKGWTDYAIPYMWGTMGFIYNPEFVAQEDAESWACVLSSDYTNKTTIKDSVRDTYFLGVALANLEELAEKNATYSNGGITENEYSSYLSGVFNDTSEETVSKVEQLLKDAKENAFSLEVDAGKSDIATGKVWINFAWSGDAVYAMDEAEGVYLEESELASYEPMILNYAVPKEGSNIWFDGWVMPKGANKKLATAFLNYISLPENAIANMDYIGYTSSIAGQEVFDRAVEYACGEEIDEAEKTPENYVDLSYFFGDTIEGDATVYVLERGRQFDAQYPPEEIINRCTIMNHFDNEANARVNDMWNKVKTGGMITDVIIIVICIAIGILLFISYLIIRNGGFESKPPKGYKKIS